MKKKQAIAFLLSTAMTTGTVIPAFGASNDISGHWAEATIAKWQNDGKIGGYEDGTFKPDKTITRAEFVRLLNTTTTTSFVSNANMNFSDVKESDWFFADVTKAVGSGITNGFEDGTFRPSETVTRAQAAVFICKAKGLALDETRANLFVDASEIPTWAKGAVGAAVNAGYLSGYPDGTFGANKGMTRAEAVSTLDRLSGSSSNKPADPNQGVSTPSDEDSQQKEQTSTAKTGDMVWASGGSGGGRKSSSSSGGGSSSSSSNVVSKAVSIRSQSDADEYKGKTLTGKATIYAKDGLELQDIRFKGDVDIIADSTATAAAYIENDTAVAAAYLSNINIYFEGRTNISGTITVIRDGVPASTQVIIRTRTPRAISAIVKALLPTKIVGFEVSKVEAKAPVEVAQNAKVGTITADNGASVVAEGEVENVNVVGKVDNIELSGTGNTDVTVDDGAKVEKIDVSGNVNADVKVNGNAEVKDVAVGGSASAAVAVNDNATVSNVAVSDSAAAKVDIKDTAKVEKVDIADSATAKVDVAPEAKVDKVTSTSTAEGSTVTGEGEVGKIESANPGTLTPGEEVSTPVETPPTTDDDNKTETPPDIAVTDITLDKETLSLKVGDAAVTLKATVTPDNATNKTVTWTSSDPEKVTVENGKVTAVAVTETDKPVTITAKAGDKTATCEVTVAAADTPVQPTKPADPVADNFTLEKTVETDAETGKETVKQYKLISKDGGTYQYALGDTEAPAADSTEWKDVINGGTAITATDTTGKTLYIRAVNKTTTPPLYSDKTITLAWTAAVTPNPVTKIELNKTALPLKEGETDETLTVTFTPNTATNKVVTWASSDEKVATVDANGKVTAVKEGTATITVTSAADNTKTATCTVTVTAKVADTVVIKANDKNIATDGVTLQVNDTVTITATKNGTAVNGIKLESADTATVSVEGTTIKGVKAGNTTITVKDGTDVELGTVKVSVVQTAQKPTDPVKDNFTLTKKGEKYTLKATDTDTGKYEYVLGDSTQPAEDVDWTAVTNAGTEFTSTAAQTHIYIRAVGGTTASPLYSANSISFALSEATETPAGAITATVTTGATGIKAATPDQTVTLTLTGDNLPEDTALQGATWAIKFSKAADAAGGTATDITIDASKAKTIAYNKAAKTVTITTSDTTFETADTYTFAGLTATKTGESTPILTVKAAESGTTTVTVGEKDNKPATPIITVEKGTAPGKTKITISNYVSTQSYEYAFGDGDTAPTNASDWTALTITDTTNKSGEIEVADANKTKKNIFVRVKANDSATPNVPASDAAKEALVINGVYNTKATVASSNDVKVNAESGNVVINLSGDLSELTSTGASTKATVKFTQKEDVVKATPASVEFTNCDISFANDSSTVTAKLSSTTKFTVVGDYVIESVTIPDISGSKVIVTPDAESTLTVNKAALTVKANLETGATYDQANASSATFTITLSDGDGSANNVVPTNIPITLDAENVTMTFTAPNSGGDKTIAATSYAYDSNNKKITVTGATFDADGAWTLKSVVINGDAWTLTANAGTTVALTVSNTPKTSGLSDDAGIASASLDEESVPIGDDNKQQDDDTIKDDEQQDPDNTDDSKKEDTDVTPSENEGSEENASVESPKDTEE